MLNFLLSIRVNSLAAKLIIATNITSTAAVAHVSSNENPSFALANICTASVLPESIMLPGSRYTMPAVINTAALSPTILPTDNITDDIIPDNALGSVILNSVYNLEAPSAKLASL